MVEGLVYHFQSKNRAVWKSGPREPAELKKERRELVKMSRK